MNEIPRTKIQEPNKLQYSKSEITNTCLIGWNLVFIWNLVLVS
jgi:hypothetical protein